MGRTIVSLCHHTPPEGKSDVSTVFLAIRSIRFDFETDQRKKNEKKEKGRDERFIHENIKIECVTQEKMTKKKKNISIAKMSHTSIPIHMLLLRMDAERMSSSLMSWEMSLQR